MAAMLTPADVAHFCELLTSFLSSDNLRRKESEKVYQATKQRDPDRLCLCLVTILTQAPDDALRQQSAVLLRQCLKSTRSDFVWPLVQPETQGVIKARLVSALRSERLRQTRHKICDAVSMLACHVLDPSTGEGWPEIGQVLSEIIESEGSDQRESALRVVKDMLTVSPAVVQALVGGKLRRLLEITPHDTSPQVRKESVLLFAAALEHLPVHEWEPLRDLMPAMLSVMQQFESSEDELQECLEAFVQVADLAPQAFQQHLSQVVPMMLAIGRARGYLQDGVRQMAFEFLASFAEKRAKMCSKYPDFTMEVVKLCMEFMLELEEQPNWAEDSDPGGVEISNYDVGEENIDRFARALGADAVLGHVFTVVREFIHQTSWKHRYVAIMTLSQCAETVEEEKHVDEIIQLLVSLLRDEHPRVRFAALHAIGQTATDHTPYLQETHNELVLPALLRLMDDPVVRVASHACAAFVNFVEDLDYEVLLPWVSEFMAKLCQRMVAPARVAREQAITAIAVIASVIQTDFVPYYQKVVPVLKHTVLTATSREERSLRGKAFECMSLLGMAVGREVFKQDAQEAMQAMMETAVRGLEPDDPQRSYIHEAAQRICRALKEHFLPYLQYLLPGVYAMLQMQPTEVLDPDAEENEEDMTITFLQDGTAVGLKTSQIEDFQSAVQMLACFLEVLGGNYFDHIRDTARCLMPALTFHFSNDVRREANQTWQELITAAKAGLQQRQIRDDNFIPELLRAYLRTTLEAMAAEDDVELLQVQASGLASCIRAAGPGAMTPNEVKELCAEVKQRLSEASERHWGAQYCCEGMDEDEQAEAKASGNAEQVLRVKYAELIGAVMEVHKESFLQGGLEHFVPVIQEYMGPESTPTDRCVALYLAGYVLEKLRKEGVPVWHVFVTQMVEAIGDADGWVRQAAAYCVLHASTLSEFALFADKAAQALGEVVAAPESKRGGNKEAAEASVAALGRLCRNQGAQISRLDHHLLLFLHALPLVEDVDQASPTHELLLTFVQEGHPLFQKHAGKVCRVLLEVYNHETSTEALNAGICRAFLAAGEERLRQMQPPFSDKQRKKIQRILRDARKLAPS